MLALEWVQSKHNMRADWESTNAETSSERKILKYVSSNY